MSGRRNAKMQYCQPWEQWLESNLFVTLPSGCRRTHATNLCPLDPLCRRLFDTLHAAARLTATPSACTDAGRRGAVRGTAAPLAACPSSERPEHRLGLLQVCCLKALGEPAVDRRQELPRLLPLTLALPQPAQAHCRLELKRLGLLAASYVEGLLQTDFSCPALGWRAVLC